MKKLIVAALIVGGLLTAVPPSAFAGRGPIPNVSFWVFLCQNFGIACPAPSNNE
jgi:hypothetical protein